jgi:hypothetical protein
MLQQSCLLFAMGFGISAVRLAVLVALLRCPACFPCWIHALTWVLMTLVDVLSSFGATCVTVSSPTWVGMLCRCVAYRSWLRRRLGLFMTSQMTLYLQLTRLQHVSFKQASYPNHRFVAWLRHWASRCDECDCSGIKRNLHSSAAIHGPVRKSVGKSRVSVSFEQGNDVRL